MEKDCLEKMDYSILSSNELWNLDKAKRFDLDEFNQSFHDSVPALKYLDWSITKIERGYCEAILPHNVASTNQYITHQAALQLVAADYTGGIALCTLFHNVPVIGFHRLKTDYGMYIWGGKATIKWYYPSCDDLICKATIPEKDWEPLARRFFSGKRIVVTVPINLYNGDRLVARAELTYWVQDSHGLRDNKLEENKVHFLYDLKYKTSAQLIAGLRAIEQEKPADERLFDDIYAFMAAQNYGVTLAKRYSQHMPQLQHMVAARTKHLDELILSLKEDWQIIIIGTGLDCRAWRLKLNNPVIFELDTPQMLKEREEVLPDISDAKGKVVRVPVDLRKQNIDELITQDSAYDANKATLIIWEGGSMFFNEHDSDRLITSVSKLLSDVRSLFWFDFASDALVKNTTGLSSIETFVRGMRRMGEPFVTGYRDINETLKHYGLIAKQVDTANLYLESDDPIYGHYSFCTVKKLPEYQS